MYNTPAETKKIARSIYQQWVDAMICPKNDVQKVLDLYHADAVLLPTFSPIICTTHEQLHTYFKNLITLPTLSISTEEFISSECNQLIVNSGIYTFSYIAEEKRIDVPARFSFVHKNYAGTWLIINHHSSVLPVQSISV
jgi:hypothetical protein